MIRCLSFSFVHVLLFLFVYLFFGFSTRNCGNPSVMFPLAWIRPRLRQQAKPGVPDIRLPSNISPLPPGGSRSIQARWDTYIILPVSSGSSPSWPCPEDLHEEASSLIRCLDHLGREKWSWWMAERCWGDWKQGCIKLYSFSFVFLIEIELNVKMRNVLVKPKQGNRLTKAAEWADWKKGISENYGKREK